MAATELSILIPSRNEMFLKRTVDDLLDNIEADTEILIGLDGKWSDPGIPQHPRVNIIYYPEPIGQRAMTNQLCKLSRAKYVAKVDAHCSFDKGFDRKMIEGMQEAGDDVAMAPTMRNLHAFDWVCANGHRRYQGPSGNCTECGESTIREMVWKPRHGTSNCSFCFDSKPHFQYFKDFSHRPEGKGDLTESMSLQGSFFMLTRAKYWELDICEEAFGSWGSQGIEVACKLWLSGGKVMVNHKTWYAHMFRTQGGDFSFPYEQKQSQVDNAKNYARQLFFEGRWPKAKRPLSWLVKRFAPVPGWEQTAIDALDKQ